MADSVFRHGEPVEVDYAAQGRPSTAIGKDTELTPPELNRGIAHVIAGTAYRKAGHEELASAEFAKIDSNYRLSTNTVVHEAMIIGASVPLGTIEVHGESPFVPTRTDIDIVQALAESQHAIPLEDLAQASGHNRKKCGERIPHLKGAGLVAAPPGKVYEVGATKKGRDWIQSRSDQT